MIQYPTPLESRPAWHQLQQLAARKRALRVADLVAIPRRDRRFCVAIHGVTLDLSRQRIDDETLGALLALADESALNAGLDAMFRGEAINHTESRAALHVALRDHTCIPPADRDAVLAAEQQMCFLTRSAQAGNWRGASGERITQVVNLGIGGSDLGPRMACEALAPWHHAGLRVHFVANIDPRALDSLLATLPPAQTLFIVASKSFTTTETLANATAARDWLRAALGADANIAAHFIGLTNATDKAVAFGLSPDRLLPLPAWVGGRYSVWSVIGLPLMLAIGERQFEHFLAGARLMDQHVRETPYEQNLAVLLALVGLWNTSLLGIPTQAVLPYAEGLRNFTAWLQQLEMESNGKRVRHDGSSVPCPTAPVIWGGAGTVGQHAYHQLMYQGTHEVAIDFIVPIGDDDPRQRALVGNALAQAAALMSGRTIAQCEDSLRAQGLSESAIQTLAPHLVIPGNQPSSTLMMPALGPLELGQLMALYEHKTFLQGWLWGINSFDQFGVELGKIMARALDDRDTPLDATTRRLMDLASEMWRQQHRHRSR